MSRFTPENLDIARQIIGRYPHSRSALIPLCHLAQEQDGYLTADGMAHIAELLDITPAEVLGTASFYEMFKMHPVGDYLVGVCTNISCMLLGAYELLEHCEQKLGVKTGGTTPDGKFSLEDMECLAACTEAPCLQVNYRYFNKVTPDDVDRLVDDLRAGRRDDEIPRHGVLARVRQTVAADRWAGRAAPGPARRVPSAAPEEGA
jgi:NADH-quinone oxidoreductase subunit E